MQQDQLQFVNPTLREYIVHYNEMRLSKVQSPKNNALTPYPNANNNNYFNTAYMLTQTTALVLSPQKLMEREREKIFRLKLQEIKKIIRKYVFDLKVFSEIQKELQNLGNMFAQYQALCSTNPNNTSNMNISKSINMGVSNNISKSYKSSRQLSKPSSPTPLVMNPELVTSYTPSNISKMRKNGSREEDFIRENNRGRDQKGKDKYCSGDVGDNNNRKQSGSGGQYDKMNIPVIGLNQQIFDDLRTTHNCNTNAAKSDYGETSRNLGNRNTSNNININSHSHINNNNNSNNSNNNEYDGNDQNLKNSFNIMGSKFVNTSTVDVQLKYEKGVFAKSDVVILDINEGKGLNKSSNHIQTQPTVANNNKQQHLKQNSKQQQKQHKNVEQRQINTIKKCCSLQNQQVQQILHANAMPIKNKANGNNRTTIHPRDSKPSSPIPPILNSNTNINANGNQTGNLTGGATNNQDYSNASQMVNSRGKNRSVRVYKIQPQTPKNRGSNIANGNITQNRIQKTQSNEQEYYNNKDNANTSHDGFISSKNSSNSITYDQKNIFRIVTNIVESQSESDDLNPVITNKGITGSGTGIGAAINANNANAGINMQKNKQPQVQYKQYSSHQQDHQQLKLNQISNPNTTPTPLYQTTQRKQRNKQQSRNQFHHNSHSGYSKKGIVSNLINSIHINTNMSSPNSSGNKTNKDNSTQRQQQSDKNTPDFNHSQNYSNTSNQSNKYSNGTFNNQIGSIKLNSRQQLDRIQAFQSISDIMPITSSPTNKLNNYNYNYNYASYTANAANLAANRPTSHYTPTNNSNTNKTTRAKQNYLPINKTINHMISNYNTNTNSNNNKNNDNGNGKDCHDGTSSRVSSNFVPPMLQKKYSDDQQLESIRRSNTSKGSCAQSKFFYK